MQINQFFLAQLDREVAASRKVLDRVPEGRNSFKPHEKSMELGYLAALVAQMPGWIAMMISTDELNFDKGGASGLQAKAAESRQALLQLAEDNYAKAKQALETTTEDHLNGNWIFVMGGKAIGSGPRHQQIADAFTHLAHHRGQLTIYLRLNEVKVPAIYGPSADERF
jgi:uncharacterized damage-inducible protein DinB